MGKPNAQQALCDGCGWMGAFPAATGVCPSCKRGMDIGNVELALRAPVAQTGETWPNGKPLIHVDCPDCGAGLDLKQGHDDVWRVRIVNSAGVAAPDGDLRERVEQVAKDLERKASSARGTPSERGYRRAATMIRAALLTPTDRGTPQSGQEEAHG